MIDQFQIKIQSYDISHFEMKQIIKRFDEVGLFYQLAQVILEKASKFSIEQLRVELNNYTKQFEFKNLHSKLKELDKEITEKLVDISSLIDKIKVDCLDELETKTATAFREIKKQVLDSLGGKPVDINELKTLLLVKADKSEIGILDKLKADKEVTSKYCSI